MPDIGNIGSSSGFSGLSAVSRSVTDSVTRNATATVEEQSSRSDTRDRVEVSDHARYLATLRSMPPIRADKVAQIKAQVEDGTYETDEKLAVAIDRLLAEHWDDLSASS